jgi:hypothetical protein
MTDALQDSHPEVPFARVRDDTISALAELATIFKLKLRQTPSPTAHMAIDLGNNHWSQQHLANAIIHPVTGK